MPDDEPASTAARELPETTTDATGCEETGTTSHAAYLTDPADLGGESPCLAHLLDDLCD
jgi:hypothetical protein